MLGKLFKTNPIRNETAADTPAPDLSRIFKSSPVKAERPAQSVTVETQALPEAAEETSENGVSVADQVAWLRRDVDTLKSAFDTYTQRVSSRDARRQLFIASHNLRGTAEPFGNPVLGRLAGSLCTLLERSPADEPVVALANLHVEAMRAAIAIGPGAATDELAQTVCVALEDQVSAKLQA